LGVDDAEHVGDVQRKIDAGMQQMRTLAEAGQRRRERIMTSRAQPVGNPLPAPAAVPRAVDEDEGRHFALLVWPPLKAYPATGLQVPFFCAQSGPVLMQCRLRCLILRSPPKAGVSKDNGSMARDALLSRRPSP